MKHWTLVIGGGVLVVLLAGAAFVGGRLISGTPGGNGLISGPIPGGGDGAVQSVRMVRSENASELPDRSADVVGGFVRREDNMVVIQTITTPQSGAVVARASGPNDMAIGEEGPKVEVVVTQETQVYKDVTEFNMDAINSGTPIEQKVAAGSVDEMGSNSIIAVWGTRRGDRWIAEVLLYSEPQIFAAP